jgi:hypothetical protein
MPASILCISDFSDIDMNALPWAIAKAGIMQLHLSILFAFRLPGSHDRENILQMKKKFQEDATERFKKIEKDFFTATKVPHEFNSEIGFAYDRIKDKLKNGTIDCVVTDRSYYEKNKDCFDQVMEKLSLPVVIVP